jgi:uracil-DNA glycosylase
MPHAFKFRNTLITYHPSWGKFITPEILELLKSIEINIDTDSTPETTKIFRFLSVDIANVRCIILGQDPYPQPGVATGRAFEVAGFNSWESPIPNGSLRNILKLLHRNALRLGYTESIEQVRLDIAQKKFTLLPPPALFDSWEKQGVLLLNASLTCKLNEPNSHAAFWLPFTLCLIRFITGNYPCITWVLWGKSAWELCKDVPEKAKLLSYHPRLNNKGALSFFGENHFAMLPQISWTGLGP